MERTSGRISPELAAQAHARPRGLLLSLSSSHSLTSVLVSDTAGLGAALAPFEPAPTPTQSAPGTNSEAPAVRMVVPGAQAAAAADNTEPGVSTSDTASASDE